MFLLINTIWDGKKEEAVTVMNRTEDSLLSPNRMLNIAHRGASGHAPEHTMKAYQLAMEIGVDYLEIDLQMTKDGRLVSMHDPDVSRTTDGSGLVSEYTLAELQKLDAGAWYNQNNPDKANKDFVGLKVPTLDEIFEHFGKKANYYIEIKQPSQSPGMISSLLKTLKKYDLLDPNNREGSVIIQSFSEESLQQIHQRAPPSIPLIQLKGGEAITKKQLEKIKEYASGVGVNAKLVDRKFASMVRDAELLLHVYTVNEKEQMVQLLEWGATGLFTNYPDRLKEVLKEIH